MPQYQLGSNPFTGKKKKTITIGGIEFDTDIEGSGEERTTPSSTGEESDWGDYAAMVLRGAAGFSPPFHWGAGINAAAELGAQTLEGRPEYNWTQVGTQAALGAIPFGRAYSIPRAVGRGALFGAGATVATQQAEEGFHVPREDELPGIALGTTLGAGGGALGGFLQKKAFEKGVTGAVRKKLGFDRDRVITPEAPIHEQVIQARREAAGGGQPAPIVRGGDTINPLTGEVITPRVTTPSQTIPSVTAATQVPVKFNNVFALIDRIPNTPDSEFNNSVNKLKAYVKASTRGELEPEQVEELGELATFVRSHPSLPPEFRTEWDNLGEIGRKKRGRPRREQAKSMFSATGPEIGQKILDDIQTGKIKSPTIEATTGTPPVRTPDNVKADVLRAKWETLRTKWGKRPDGTLKGIGYFGPLQGPQGSVMTELSANVKIDGKPTEIPLIVPTLSPVELKILLNLPEGERPPRDIVLKAVEFAKERMAKGISPFADSAEANPNQYPEFPRFGTMPKPTRETPIVKIPGEDEGISQMARYPRTPPDALHDAAVQRDRLAGISRIKTPERARYFMELQEELLDDIQKRTPNRATAIQQTTELYNAARSKYDELTGGKLSDDALGAATRVIKGQIKTDIDRQINQLTSGYNTSLEGIMLREMFQNSKDAIAGMGKKGNVDVDIHMVKGDKYIVRVTDNGKGMTGDDVNDFFTTLFGSGKVSDTGATGGKGIGKAPFMLGGDYFKLNTVGQYPDGRKVRVTFEGTPEQIASQKTQFDIIEEDVPRSTPTGTIVETMLKGTQSDYYARKMLTNIVEHSRGLDFNVNYRDVEGLPSAVRPFSTAKETETATFENVGQGKSKVKIYTPHDAITANRGSVDLHVLNNGMYQYTAYMYPKEGYMPNKLIVDVRPTVDENHPHYPFSISREAVKQDVENAIEDLAKIHILDPSAGARTRSMQELYDGIPEVTPLGGKATTRTPVFFDPGARLSNQEAAMFGRSPVVSELVYEADRFIDELLTQVGRQAWTDRLEKVGIILEERLYGIHIPNPTTSRSMILINHFGHIEDHPNSPEDAAFATVITKMHEGAHIGRGDIATPPQFDLGEIRDPRLGKLFQSYLEQTTIHGGLKGHGVEFLKNLGEVYAKLGPRRILEAVDNVTRLLTTEYDTAGNTIGITRGYSREVQRLLQAYKTSRGRTATTEDLLTGTGVKQTASTGGTGSIQQNAGSTGTGTSGGGGSGPNRKSWRDLTVSEVANITKSASSSGDLSAPMRQGIFFIGRDAWRRSWIPMLKSLKTKNYEDVMNDVYNNPRYFEALRDGIKFTEPAGIGKGEEHFGSRLLHGLPGVGKYLIKPSERAYTAFLNNLRMGLYSDLVDKAERLQAKDPSRTPVNKRKLAGYINTGSGRGNLELTISGKKRSQLGMAEKAADLMNSVFFSPRFIASRVQLLNPYTYYKLDPFTRKEALRDLATVAGAASAVLGIAEMNGADVTLDPREADFGKIKVGNTRVDVLGGFGQFIRLYSLIGQGVATDKPGADVQRFEESKWSPTARMIKEIASGKDFFGRDIKPHQSIMNAFIPLIMQDAYSLWKEDPTLSPETLTRTGVGTALSGIGLPTSSYAPRGRGGTPSGMPRVNLPSLSTPQVNAP